MPRWPIRLKLIVGLSVVVGMMLILMGASIFGLHSFHMSYLTLADQLPELGASADLIESVYRLHAPREGTTAEMEELRQRVVAAQDALLVYFRQLKKNTNQGSRVDSGTDELGLAFLIDDDLAEIRQRARAQPRARRRRSCRARRSTSSFIPRCSPPSNRPRESRSESSGCTKP